MRTKLIVAMTPDRLIGRDGTLPWHEPADLKYFKSLTAGHAIIMGRRTYESIGKPLPYRRNIVISRRGAIQAPAELKMPASLDTVTSLSAALEICWERNEEIAFIIGGAMVFAAAMPLVEELVITWIDRPDLIGDTYFPEWNRSDWIEAESSVLSPTARVVHYRRRT